MRKKEQEDKDGVSLDQYTAKYNPIDPLAPSSDTITTGHIPLVELGLVPFIPSKKHVVACLNTIFFDKNKKTIVRR